MDFENIIKNNPDYDTFLKNYKYDLKTLKTHIEARYESSIKERRPGNFYTNPILNIKADSYEEMTKCVKRDFFLHHYKFGDTLRNIFFPLLVILLTVSSALEGMTLGVVFGIASIYQLCVSIPYFINCFLVIKLFLSKKQILHDTSNYKLLGYFDNIIGSEDDYE